MNVTISPQVCWLGELSALQLKDIRTNRQTVRTFRKHLHQSDTTASQHKQRDTKQTHTLAANTHNTREKSTAGAKDDKEMDCKNQRPKRTPVSYWTKSTYLNLLNEVLVRNTQFSVCILVLLVM